MAKTGTKYNNLYYKSQQLCPTYMIALTFIKVEVYSVFKS